MRKRREEEKLLFGLGRSSRAHRISRRPMRTFFYVNHLTHLFLPPFNQHYATDIGSLSRMTRSEYGQVRVIIVHSNGNGNQRPTFAKRM